MQFGREAYVFALADSAIEGFRYYGQVDELQVAFDAVDGWTVYMSLVTEVDPSLLFVPDGTSGDAARLLVEVTILRPDDPTVVVDVPEVIDPALVGPTGSPLPRRVERDRQVARGSCLAPNPWPLAPGL